MEPHSPAEKLNRTFYLRPTVEVARSLLGCYLHRRLGRETLIGRIVEVEAYTGSGDPASHSYRGKTNRNGTMFKQGGHLYVYFTYGMHFCANVVTEGEGSGAAVLVRALEPIRGVRTMERLRSGRKTRGEKPPVLHRLCNGPANLCSALDITGIDDGTDLCGDQIWLSRAGSLNEPVSVSRRVGISKGVSRRWRFFLKDSPFVSPGRPS